MTTRTELDGLIAAASAESWGHDEDIRAALDSLFADLAAEREKSAALEVALVALTADVEAHACAAIPADAIWYVTDPDDGVQICESAAEARAMCESALDDLRDGSADDSGWHENVADLAWGYMVPCAEVRQHDVVDAADDPSIAARGWDYWCDYRLHETASAPVAALTNADPIAAPDAPVKP